MNKLLAISLSAVVAMGAAVAKDDPQKILERLPKGTIIERDIVYATNGEREMLLDVYRPKSDKPLPLVIWFYGGAWDWGNKDRSQPLIPMLSRGYAIAGVTHTTVSYTHLTLPTIYSV